MFGILVKKLKNLQNKFIIDGAMTVILDILSSMQNSSVQTSRIQVILSGMRNCGVQTSGMLNSGVQDSICFRHLKQAFGHSGLQVFGVLGTS